MKNRFSCGLIGLCFLFMTGCAGIEKRNLEFDYFSSLSPNQIVSGLNEENINSYVKNYLRPNETYKKIQSVSETHQKKSGDCNDTTILIANVLADEGYEPTALVLKDNEGAHMVFLYEKEGKFGTKGANHYDFLEPVYDNLEEVVKKFGFLEYAVAKFNLEYDWINEGLDLKKLRASKKGEYFTLGQFKRI